MNQLQLGDYRGGRDSITGLMNAEIPQLQNVTAAAQAFGSIGLQSMAQRHGIADQYNYDLRNKMALADKTLSAQMGIGQMNQAYKEQAAAAQANAQEQQAQDILGGEEQAMLDWASNVIQQYEPDSPEHKQAARTLQMLKNRRHGSAGFNKGYSGFVGEHDVSNMLSQGSLGAAGWQQAKKPVPAASKKPLPKPAPSGYGDEDLHS